MLSRPEALKERVERLLGDLAGLPSISALGFHDPSAQNVKDNLRTLGSEPSWRFIDLTGNAKVEAAVDELLKSKRVLIAARPGAVPAALMPHLRALIDKRSTLEVKPGAAKERPAGQQVIVLFEGAKSLADVPAPLHSIPYWDFMP